MYLTSMDIRITVKELRLLVEIIKLDHTLALSMNKGISLIRKFAKLNEKVPSELIKYSEPPLVSDSCL